MSDIPTTPLPQVDPQQDINTAPMRAVDERRAIIEEGTQELSKAAMVSAANSHLTFGQTTDVGMIRTNNEDSSYVFVSISRTADAIPEFGIFLVADGMGGHVDGEFASAAAVRIAAAELMKSVYLPFLTMTDATDRMPISEALESAFAAAHKHISDEQPAGGTTMTALVVMGNLAHLAHVGDSRCYLATDGKIDQISRDHSYVARLIELNELAPEEAENHPQKSVLYRAIGLSEDLDVDTMTRRLPPGAMLFLCSDGLSGLVHESEILSYLQKFPPQQACDHLVTLANARGGNDNITAVAVKLPG
ncbi:MAG: serine/threonine-protein phosphatase [Chloroflexi bacterium]|nr:serine/threonine-protein phosphatase [Chloroflexota bacterium]